VAKQPPSTATKSAQDEFWAWARENEQAYIEEICQVVNKQAKKVPFKLNVQQVIVNEAIAYCDDNWEPGRFAINKYRQPGISKFMGVKVHARTITRENRTALITAHRKGVAEKNLRLQKQHIANLPAALRPQIGVDNKGEVYLEDRNCSISCNSANDPSAARGDTVHDWILTEAAYYGEQGASLSDVLDAGMQQVPEEPFTLIALETTCNGTSDEFYDFYNKAKGPKPMERGENGFIAIFLNFKNDPACQRPFHGDIKLQFQCPWFDHPECKTWAEAKKARESCDLCRQERAKWAANFLNKELKQRMVRYGLDYEQMHWYWYYLNRRLRGDKLKMMQEYPCDDVESFIASGTPLFDGEIVAEVKKHCKRGTLFDLPMERVSWEDLTENDTLQRNKDPYLEVWVRPQSGRTYILAADSSLGEAKGNPSATYVVDADSMDNVAAIHGRIDPDLYGEVLTYVGYLYNIALIAPEVENTGHAVLAALNRLNYPNIYQRYQLTPEGWMQTQQLGWSTNMKSKPQMVAVGRKLFNQLGLSPKQIAQKVKDVELCDELSKFTVGSFGKRSMGAKSGACDDRPIAWFISQMVCHQEQGLDIGEAVSVSREAKDAKEYGTDATRRRNKTKTASEMKELFRQRKLWLAGMEPEEIEEQRDIISLDDYDIDDYYTEEAYYG